MNAVDTNILARYVTGDDPVQSRLATKVLSQPCYIAHTALLKTAWLLSSCYGMDRPALSATLADLLLLPTVTVDDADLLDWAIERFAAGADLADMLHLVASRGADAFVSFDTRLAGQAGASAPLPVERLA